MTAEPATSYDPKTWHEDQVMVKIDRDGNPVVNWNMGDGWEPLSKYGDTVIEYEAVDVS